MSAPLKLFSKYSVGAGKDLPLHYVITHTNKHSSKDEEQISESVILAMYNIFGAR